MNLIICSFLSIIFIQDSHAPSSAPPNIITDLSWPLFPTAHQPSLLGNHIITSGPPTQSPKLITEYLSVNYISHSEVISLSLLPAAPISNTLLTLLADSSLHMVSYHQSITWSLWFCFLNIPWIHSLFWWPSPFCLFTSHLNSCSCVLNWHSPSHFSCISSPDQTSQPHTH